MKNNVDDPLRSVMQHFANELVVHEIPPAAQSWSQIQFRLRYRLSGETQLYVHIDADSSSYLTLLLVVRLAGGRSLW